MTSEEIIAELRKEVVRERPAPVRPWRVEGIAWPGFVSIVDAVGSSGYLVPCTEGEAQQLVELLNAD